MLLLPLHNHKQYTEQCAKVLSEEWQRSLTARCHSLEKSNDLFPISLVLLDDTTDQVIGHSRISKVQGEESSCFVESVVIRKDMRGKGLGRELMEATENYAKSLSIATLYLTTTDKEKFYSHIGYSYCQPVISLGCVSTLLSPDKLANLFGKQSVTSKPLMIKTPSVSQSDVNKNEDVPPAPPPPAAPHVTSSHDNHSNIQRLDPRHVKWMKKTIAM